jgi:hypothetical protein
MSIRQEPVKTEASDLELIVCRRQPGKLRISKRGCALRYLKAHQRKGKRSSRSFGVIRGQGLEICRSCPEGRQCAEETPYPHYQKGRGKESRRVG